MKRDRDRERERERQRDKETETDSKRLSCRQKRESSIGEMNKDIEKILEKECTNTRSTTTTTTTTTNK